VASFETKNATDFATLNNFLVYKMYQKYFRLTSSVVAFLPSGCIEAVSL
jgi:hypothetical protein